jgi:hypothetical protein
VKAVAQAYKATGGAQPSIVFKVVDETTRKVKDQKVDFKDVIDFLSATEDGAVINGILEAIIANPKVVVEFISTDLISFLHALSRNSALTVDQISRLIDFLNAITPRISATLAKGINVATDVKRKDDLERNRKEMGASFAALVRLLDAKRVALNEKIAAAEGRSKPTTVSVVTPEQALATFNAIIEAEALNQDTAGEHYFDVNDTNAGTVDAAQAAMRQAKAAAEPVILWANTTDNVEQLKALVTAAFSKPGALRTDGATLAILSMALANQRLTPEQRNDLYAHVRQLMQNALQAADSTKISNPKAFNDLAQALFVLESEMIMNDPEMVNAIKKEMLEELTDASMAKMPSVLEIFKRKISEARGSLRLAPSEMEGANTQRLSKEEYQIYAEKIFAHAAFRAYEAEQIRNNNRDSGMLDKGIFLREIQKDIVKGLDGELLSLGSTAIGKTIVALIKFGMDQEMARANGDRVGTVTVAETKTAVNKFVDGEAILRGLKIGHQRLARVFGMAKVVDLEKLLEDRNWAEIIKALKDDSVHKVLAPDQVGFAALTLKENGEAYALFKAKLDSFVIEEIDKYLASQTHYILSDMKRAIKNEDYPAYAGRVQKLFDLFGINFNADGSEATGKIKIVKNSAEADDLVRAANLGHQEILVVVGDGRNKNVYLSEAMKTRLLHKEKQKPAEVEEAMRAFAMHYGEDFVNSLIGELKPVEGGSQQSTHFHGKVTKIVLSLMANQIVDRKVKALQAKLENAVGEERARLGEEIAREKASKIDEMELENSLTEATSTQNGILKELIREARGTLAEPIDVVGADQTTDWTPIKVGATAGLEAETGSNLSVRQQGGKLYVRGRGGMDVVLISDIPEDSTRSLLIPVLAVNNHIEIARKVLEDGKVQIILRKNVRITGSTATYSPNGLVLVGIRTVARDRSAFRLTDTAGAPTWEWLNEINAQTVLNHCDKELGLETAQARRTALRDFVATVEDGNVEILFDLMMASLQRGFSHLTFVDDPVEYENLLKIIETKTGTRFTKITIGEQVAKKIQALNAVESEIKALQRSKEFGKKKQGEIQRIDKQIADHEARKKLAEAAIEEAVKAEEAALEALKREDGHFLFVIDAKSHSDLINKLAGVAGNLKNPSLIVTNNIADTQQGVDFDGNFNLTVKSGKRGFREIRQMLGRIVRSDNALGNRYFLLPREAFAESRQDVMRYRDDMRRAFTRIAAEFEENLRAALRKGGIPQAQYNDDMANNEFRKTLALLDRLDVQEKPGGYLEAKDNLTNLEWFMLTSAYHYLRQDVSEALLHKFSEDIREWGHSRFRQMISRAHDLETAAYVAKEKKQPLTPGPLEAALRKVYESWQNQESTDEDAVKRLDFQEREMMSGERRLRQRIESELKTIKTAFEHALDEVPSGKAVASEIQGYLDEIQEARNLVDPKKDVANAKKQAGGPDVFNPPAGLSFKARSLLTTETLLETIQIAVAVRDLIMMREDAPKGSTQAPTIAQMERTAQAGRVVSDITATEPAGEAEGYLKDTQRGLTTQRNNGGRVTTEWTQEKGRAFAVLMQRVFAINAEQIGLLRRAGTGDDDPKDLLAALGEGNITTAQAFAVARWLSGKGYVDLLDTRRQGFDQFLGVLAAFQTAGRNVPTSMELFEIFDAANPRAKLVSMLRKDLLNRPGEGTWLGRRRITAVANASVKLEQRRQDAERLERNRPRKWQAIGFFGRWAHRKAMDENLSNRQREFYRWIGQKAYAYSEVVYKVRKGWNERRQQWTAKDLQKTLDSMKIKDLPAAQGVDAQTALAFYGSLAIWDDSEEMKMAAARYFDALAKGQAGATLDDVRNLTLKQLRELIRLETKTRTLTEDAKAGAKKLQPNKEFDEVLFLTDLRAVNLAQVTGKLGNLADRPVLKNNRAAAAVFQRLLKRLPSVPMNMLGDELRVKLAEILVTGVVTAADLKAIESLQKALEITSGKVAALKYRFWNNAKERKQRLLQAKSEMRKYPYPSRFWTGVDFVAPSWLRHKAFSWILLEIHWQNIFRAGEPVFVKNSEIHIGGFGHLLPYRLGGIPGRGENIGKYLIQQEADYLAAAQKLGLSPAEASARWVLDQKLWMRQQQAKTSQYGELNDAAKKSGKSLERYTQEWLDRAFPLHEQYSFERLLGLTERGENPIAIVDLWPILVKMDDHFANYNKDQVIALLSALKEKKMLRAMTVPELLEAIARASSVLGRIDIAAMSPSLFGAFVDQYHLTFVETMALAALSGLKGQDIRNMPLVPFAALLDPSSASSVQEVLQSLRGKDVVQLKKDFENAIKNPALKDRINVLQQGLARILLLEAEEKLFADQEVKGSFKGYAAHLIEQAIKLSPQAYAMGESLRARFKIQHGVDVLVPGTEPGAMDQQAKAKLAKRLKDRINEKERMVYRHRIKGMRDGFKEGGDLATLFLTDRKAAMREIARGINLYRRAQEEILPEDLEIVKFTVTMASEDPLLGRAIRELGLPDVPLPVIVFSVRSAEMLRAKGFFTGSGNASATRPEETKPGHYFSRSGYFVAKDGYESEVIEHEFKHLVDMMGMSRVVPEGFPGSPERKKWMKDGGDKELLDEFEAYLVQILLGKTMQSGADYDWDSVENGPLFSYAMDHFNKLIRNYKSQQWTMMLMAERLKIDLSDIAQDDPRRTEIIQGRIETALSGYSSEMKQKLENEIGREAEKMLVAEDQLVSLKKARGEMQKQITLLTDRYIQSAGIDKLKSEKLNEMRQSFAALRRLSRILSPKETVFIASTTRTLSDLIAFSSLTDEEILENFHNTEGMATPNMETDFDKIFAPEEELEKARTAYEKEVEDYDPASDADGARLNTLITKAATLFPEISAAEHSELFKQRIAFINGAVRKLFQKTVDAATRPEARTEQTELLQRVAAYLKSDDQEIAILAEVILFENGVKNDEVHAFNQEHIGISGRQNFMAVLKATQELQEKLQAAERITREEALEIMLGGDETPDWKAIRQKKRESVYRGLPADSLALGTGIGAYGRYMVELDAAPTREDLTQLEALNKQSLDFELAVTVVPGKNGEKDRYVLATGLMPGQAELYGETGLAYTLHTHPVHKTQRGETLYNPIPSGKMGDPVRDWDGLGQLRANGYNYILTGWGITRYSDARVPGRKKLPSIKRNWKGALDEIQKKGMEAARKGEAFTALVEDGGKQIMLIEFIPTAKLERMTDEQIREFIPFLGIAEKIPAATEAEPAPAVSPVVAPLAPEAEPTPVVPPAVQPPAPVSEVKEVPAPEPVKAAPVPPAPVVAPQPLQAETPQPVSEVKELPEPSIPEPAAAVPAPAPARAVYSGPMVTAAPQDLKDAVSQLVTIQQYISEHSEEGRPGTGVYDVLDELNAIDLMVKDAAFRSYVLGTKHVPELIAGGSSEEDIISAFADAIALGEFGPQSNDRNVEDLRRALESRSLGNVDPKHVEIISEDLGGMYASAKKRIDELRKEIPSVEGRAELRMAEPAAVAIPVPGAAETTETLDQTAQRVRSEVRQNWNRIVRAVYPGIEIPKMPEIPVKFMLPAQDQHLTPQRIAYMDHGTQAMILNANYFATLSPEFLEQMLSRAVMHETFHAAFHGQALSGQARVKAEIDAYQAQKLYAGIDPVMDMMREIALGNIKGTQDPAQRHDIIEIAQIIITGAADPMLSLETLISRLNPKVWEIYGPNEAASGLYERAIPAAQLADLIAEAERLGKNASLGHVGIRVSRALYENTEWHGALIRLAQSGVGLYIADAELQPSEVFQLVRLGARIGVDMDKTKSTFEQLLFDHGVADSRARDNGADKGAILSLQVIMASAMIKALINEMLAQQQVTVAA